MGLSGDWMSGHLAADLQRRIPYGTTCLVANRRWGSLDPRSRAKTARSAPLEAVLTARDNSVEASPHRRAARVEDVAQAFERAVLCVLSTQQARRHQEGRGEPIRLVLSSRRPHLDGVCLNNNLAAEHRCFA